MKINVDWIEHIGNLDTYTRWFQNLEISWFGDYDIGVELHRASGDETWFIKFTID